MNSDDWAQIRAEYEAGASLRQLAARYNISKSAIGERKFKEQWTQRTHWTDNQHANGTTTRDVNAATRVQKALKLKLEGMTWDDVAAQAGYGSRGSAHHAVMRELDRCITHGVTELRTQQLYMLSQLQARCYKAGMNEANKDWTWAIDRFVNLSKRISELMGLDVPVDSTINQNFTIVREVPAGWLAPVKAPLEVSA